MRWVATVQTFAKWLFRRRQVESDLDAELRDHFESEVSRGIQTGLSPGEARFAASKLMGSISLHKEQCLDEQRIGFVETTARDLRFALRGLRRTPLFAGIAVLTLGLGIGANTTLFTFIENILLSSLPVGNPERLVTLNWGHHPNLSYLNYADFRDRNKTFESLAAYRYNPANLSAHAREGFRTWGYEVTGNYFRTVGVHAMVGRFFGPEDDAAGDAKPVIVISNRLWNSRFASDPNIVGRSVKMNGFPVTVIGVADKSFNGTELIITADYWVPIHLAKQIEPQDKSLEYRTSQNYWSLGRLKENVTRRQAESDLDNIAAQLFRAYPNELNSKERFELSAPGLIGQAFRGPVTSFSAVLIGVAGIGLLLACVNLAGILLARSSDRRQEFAIRLALGASRRQIARQLFTESLLLAFLGSFAGIGVAYAVCAALGIWQPAFDVPISTTLQPDAKVVLFALALAVVTAILFGLTPAWQSAHAEIVPAIKNEPVTARLRRWTMRDLLVAGQIALSTILVISSVLVVRSLQHALSLNLGFNPDNAVSVSFDLSKAGYDDARSRKFAADIQESLAAIPGFEAAGLTSSIPLRTGGRDGEYVSRADRAVPRPEEREVGLIYNISPGYLRAAGTRLISGRGINDHDREGAPAVAVVNSELARYLFGKEEAIGRRVRIGINPKSAGLEIVGIVETGKYENLSEAPRPAVFLPIAQNGIGWTTLVARTRLPVSDATARLRKVALDADQELTLFDTGGLREQLAMPLFPARIVAVVLGAFGVLAIVLAATGLFALMAYAVSRRSREIGIRMALGARPGEVLVAVLRRTLLLCGVGLLAGVGTSLAAGKLLSAVLYQVSPHDPLTYLTALLVMSTAALVAAWGPARRAIRIDPAQTLRAN